MVPPLRPEVRERIFGRYHVRRMGDAELMAAVASVPAGGWAVGVSGGADSVALLSLLRRRPDLALHVAHLDHQARGATSAADANYVACLAAQWSLACTVARLSEVESVPPPESDSNNPSARFRAARLALFRKVVKTHGLGGVVLAHHADDQAETVLHRLLRGSGPAGLAGMSELTDVGGLVVLRPLLRVRRAALREQLMREGQCWREDESNASDRYLRNRLRRFLAGREQLTDGLLDLADASRKLRNWIRQHTPHTEAVEVLPVGTLRDLPLPLAREAARRWLRGRGVRADELTPPVLDRLITMADDAASPARQHFPGKILVRRRAGKLCSEFPLPAGEG